MAEPYHDAILRRLGMVQQLGTDALQVAQARQQRLSAASMAAQQQSFSGSLSKARNAQYSLGGAQQGNTFAAFRNAIAQRESGGNYGAVNRDSGALGKYQIMPGNIPSWSKQVLGRQVSTGQFLRSPKLQEQIAQGMLKNYYNKWGPAGAAVAWYAGPGRVQGFLRSGGGKSSFYQRSQGKYSSISAYAYGILKQMGIAR